MDKLNRRDFLKITGLYAMTLALPGCVGEFALDADADKGKPNILLIVADDQGWGDIGYHNPKIKSPNLDRLARTGVELDTHYVQPQCTPTRVALMTGRYPSRFGSHCTQASNRRAFPTGMLTMASMLKQIGYETMIIGKWHLGSKPEWGPNHYGFDYSYGSLAGAVGMYDHRYRLDSPFAKTWHRNLQYIEETGHVTDLEAREAVKFIEKKRNNPFFLYVPFHAVHTPLVEDDKWLSANRHIECPHRRLYAAAVTHMDWAVGQIIKALERTGQGENTLVIFTSDNGAQIRHLGNQYPPPDPVLEDFSSNKPLRGEKCQVYEGGIRVPAFVNWPSGLKRRKVTSPLHIVDWMPTLAKLLGYKPEKDPRWDGRDIWPVITGQQSDIPERQIYWVQGSRREAVALRCGDWKLLRNGIDKPLELYSLVDDPYEKIDLAQKLPQRLERMKILFAQEKEKDANVR